MVARRSFLPAQARSKSWHLPSPTAAGRSTRSMEIRSCLISSFEFDTMSGPSVLEYARYHRLSAPHTASDLSKYVSTISYAQIDDDALPELESPSQEDLFAESKLQLSSKAARCLAEMTKPPEPVCWEQVLKDPFRLQKLRIEPAMLSRDHETDMKWFKRPMDLSDLIKELSESCAPDTTESDDGAAFLDQCQSAAATTRKVIEYPHLETTPTALTTLLRSTQDQWTDGDLYRIYNETFTEAKVCCNPLHSSSID